MGQAAKGKVKNRKFIIKTPSLGVDFEVVKKIKINKNK